MQAETWSEIKGFCLYKDERVDFQALFKKRWWTNIKLLFFKLFV